MKTILNFSLFLFINLLYSQNHPGKYFNLLINKELKIKDLNEKESLVEGYTFFYKDEKLSKIYKEKNKGYTEYKSIVDKIFKVEDISVFTNEKGYENIVLKLYNDETKIIYYKYSKNIDTFFNKTFEVVGGIVLPENFYCDDIITKQDKFTNEIRMSVPYDIRGLTFIKTIKDNTKTIFLYISGYGLTLNLDAKGFVILFNDGTKFEKPDLKFDVKLEKSKQGFGDYNYTSIITLSDEEIKLFKEKEITDYRINLYDRSINVKDSKLLIEYIKCLSK